MRTFPSFLALLLFLSLSGCTEDQRELGLAAERTYVDLLYALQTEDQPSSSTAATAFDERIRELRKVWYRPMTTDGLDNLRYHVDLAECAYQDARQSIEEGALGLAMVQLDRAVYELGAGDRSSLEELYVGSIYDFVAAWLEVDYLFRDQGDDVDWSGLSDCSRDAHRAWKAARAIQPNAALYFDRLVDRRAFDLAHADLNARINAFYAAVQSRDPVAARDLSNEVSEALWNLLLQFGTPVGELPM